MTKEAEIEQKKKEKEQRERRRALRALRKWVHHENAPQAMSFLDMYFLPREPSFQPNPQTGTTDPYLAAFKDGQRNVLEFLQTQAQTPLTPDTEDEL